MACKGVCEKYKIAKPSVNSDGRYKMGQKRCSTCEIYVKWDGLHCPCCGSQLRYRPRNTKNRKKLQEWEMVKRI